MCPVAAEACEWQLLDSLLICFQGAGGLPLSHPTRVPAWHAGVPTLVLPPSGADTHPTPTPCRVNYMSSRICFWRRETIALEMPLWKPTLLPLTVSLSFSLKSYNILRAHCAVFILCVCVFLSVTRGRTLSGPQQCWLWVFEQAILDWCPAANIQGERLSSTPSCQTIRALLNHMFEVILW